MDEECNQRKGHWFCLRVAGRNGGGFGGERAASSVSARWKGFRSPGPGLRVCGCLSLL